MIRPTVILIILLATQVTGQITGLAEHWNMVPFSSADSIQRQDKVRFNLRVQKNIFTLFYSGELVQETVSDPGLFWNNREAFGEIALPFITMRIGKQKVEWGLVNGWYLSDRINPKDLRWHFLQPMNDIRMGINMVRLRLLLTPLFMETIWVPKYVYTSEVIQGPWKTEPAATFFDVHHYTLLKTKRNNNLYNEWGIRLAGQLNHLQYRLMWYNGYQDEVWTDYTSFTWLTEPDPVGEGTMVPQIKTDRQHYYGLDVQLPIFLITMEGELGYETPFTYNTIQEFNTETEEYQYHRASSSRILSMLGLKTPGIFGFDINAQWIRKEILDYTKSDAWNAVEQYGILSASLGIPGMAAGIDFYTLQDLNGAGGWRKLELVYMYSPKLMGTVGLYLVSGENDHWIGRFDANDMYYIKGVFTF